MSDARMSEGRPLTEHTNGDQGPVQEVLVLREAPFLDQRRAATSLPLRTVVAITAQALIVILICAAASVAFAMTRPTIRGGEVDIIYEPASEASSSVQLDRELATQQVIVRGRSVLAPIARSEHMSVERLEKATDVGVLPGTEVLRVTVASRSAAKARRIAQAIADTYIGQSTGSTGRSLQSELTALRAHLSDTQAHVAHATTPTNKAKLQRDADDTLRRITAVEARIAALPPTGNLHGTPRTLETAHVLSSPLFPKPVHAAGFGAVIGIFIAGLFSYLLLRRHRG